jgi:hypothetical protein
MVLHADAPAAEVDAFHFEAHALFVGHFAFEFDFAAGANHALPGERVAGFSQDLRHLAVVKGISGGGGDLAVGGNFAAGDLADDAADSSIARFGFWGADEFAGDLVVSWFAEHKRRGPDS